MQKHLDKNSNELRKGYYLLNSIMKVYFTGEYDKESGFATMINENNMTHGYPVCLTKYLERTKSNLN